MSLGNLVANLGVNRKGWTGGLRGAKSDLSGFASGIKGILGPIAGIVGGTLAAGASVNAARNQIKEEQKLAAVLKATGGAAGLSAKEITDLAASRQAITNFGDEATIAASSVLATFKNIKGDVFKDSIVAMQDVAAVMETDVKSGAVQLGKALNDPIKGVSALSDVGVSFTDSQRNMIKALQDSGDMMGAQRIILEELKGEFGGAAAATADPMTQIMNMVGDLSEMFGYVLLPSINAVSSAVMDSMGPLTSNADTFKTLGQSIADVISVGIVPLISVTKGAFELLITGADLFSYAMQNAGDLSQLALVEIADGVLALLPISEDTTSSIVANFVAGFAASKAVATSFVDSVVGGLEEIWNVGKAVAAAIADAFDALVKGENPLEAFGASFVETLSNQKDVQAPNIAAVMQDTFKEAKAQTMNSLKQSGGARGFLDEQRSAIQGRLATRTTPGTTDLGDLKVQTPASLATATSTASQAKNASFGLEKGSREALEKMQRNGSENKVDVQIEVAKKQAKYQRRTAVASEKQASKMERFKPMTVGAFT